MADSQLRCLDDEHVNEKIPESRPEFYYSEEQRAALEQLLRSGDGAFKMRLKEDNIRDFLSAREVRLVRDTFQEYRADGDPEAGDPDKSRGPSSADSGVHSTYWPQMSDTEVPPLDIGWSASSGVYKGVTRVSVYTHPPKESGPHIKEVVRRLIQEAQRVDMFSQNQLHRALRKCRLLSSLGFSSILIILTWILILYSKGKTNKQKQNNNSKTNLLLLLDIHLH